MAKGKNELDPATADLEDTAREYAIENIIDDGRSDDDELPHRVQW